MKTNLLSILPKDLKEENYPSHELFRCSKKCVQSFILAKELSDLNNKCFIKKDYGDEVNYQTYTNTYIPSRIDPWFIDAPQKGISRVLQVFEVVLLTILKIKPPSRDSYRVGLLIRGVPLSLDHDGVFAGFKGEKYINDIAKKLRESLGPWAKYFLKSEVPVEVKRYFHNGEHHQF